MKKLILIAVIIALGIAISYGLSYAGSSKTWSGIGKGLAIYEGVKVLTGREGNIVDDVTGGMKPRKGSSSGASYNDGYNAGYKEGYDKGYNAGFKSGVEQAAR